MARNMYRGKRQLALGLVLGLGVQIGWAQSAAEKALLGQGLHWQAQGNSDRAAEVWKKLLRMKPDQPQALYGLAQVEINLKRNAGATDILARLQGLDPKGRYALQLAQDIALNTEDAPKTLERARLLNESGETDKAIEQYPSVPVLKLALQLGAIVVPGDDSHGVSSVGRNYERGLEVLKALGHNCQWQQPMLFRW